MKQNSDIKTVVAIERHSYWLFREIKYETNRPAGLRIGFERCIIYITD